MVDRLDGAGGLTVSTMALDGAEPRSRSTDPVTSVDAGRSVDVTDSQSDVLDLFRIAKKRGVDRMADHELVALAAKYRSTYTPQRLRSARNELTRSGLIVKVADEYKPGPSKTRRAHLWALA